MMNPKIISLPFAALLAIPCRANVSAPQAASPQAAAVAAATVTQAAAQTAKDKAKTTAVTNKEKRLPTNGGGASAAATLAKQASGLLKKLRYAKAIALLNQAAAMDPESAELFSRLGDAHFQKAFRKGPEKADKKSAARAVAAYEKALALEKGKVKGSYLLYHGLALSYEAIGKPSSALETWRKAAKASPSNPLPDLYAASLRYKMGDAELSASNLSAGIRRARKINAYPSIARLIRSDAAFSGLLSSPSNQAVLDVYDAVHAGKLREDEAAQAPTDLRDSLRDIPMEAMRAPPAAVELDPRVSQPLSQADYAFQQQKYRAAIEAYKETLSADKRKGTLDPTRKSLVYERIGASYRQLGLVGEAVRFLEKALGQMPQNSEAHFQLALSFAAGGKLGSALDSLEDSLKNAATPADLRKLLLSARTEPDFQALRTLQEFQQTLSAHSQKLSAKR